MATVSALPPVRRPELLLRPLGDGGDHVVKDPRTGAFFNLGPQEAFLLQCLDGTRTVEAICAGFQERFGEPLTEEDLQGFLDLARAQGFLLPPGASFTAPPRPVEQPTPPPPVAPPPAPTPQRKRRRQSLLYWRHNLFDPDRLFNWLEPKIRFLWTRTFLVLSLLGIVAAATLVGLNGQELIGQLPSAVRWQTLLLAWLTLILVTICHEFAHGLTCKHHGGEVHEVGFLLMFFMPCLYCNVSDAWLFREKSRRLWVTFAGGYCDLCLWAAAVFVWRLTFAETLIHDLAWVVLTVCGGRIFFNFNPLLKLDGYYLLSDWAEMPNLRQRSWGYLAGHVRRLLWGAPRPEAEPRATFLLSYAVVSWLFSMVYLGGMLIGLTAVLGTRWGLLGVGVTLVLGGLTLPGMFKGFVEGEITQMLWRRHLRTAVWVSALGAGVAALFLVQMEDRAGGPFQVRPTTRAELRAPVAGFLQTVSFDEGEPVPAGSLVARLEVPDLDSRVAQKRAEVQEAQAKLYLLEQGPRPEEVAEQRKKVERAQQWRDLAERDLEAQRRALAAELARLEEQVVQSRAEVEYARYAFARDEKLFAQGTLEKNQYREKKKECAIAEAHLQEAVDQKQARETQGVHEADTELAKRRKELADAESALTLMLAGTRPEEIEAQRAHLGRLKEELRYLEGLQGKLQVCCPVGGLVTTPHLKEKVGQYLKEGDLICVVEQPDSLEAEVSLGEQELARVQEGQTVDFKARALPFETLHGTVTRIAPRTAVRAETATSVRTDSEATVTVCCRVESPPPGLRPGMTGHARISCGRRPVGAILLERGLRLLRTEFWW